MAQARDSRKGRTDETLGRRWRGALGVLGRGALAVARGRGTVGNRRDARGAAVNARPESCEVCRVAIPEPKHAFGIGGGWAFVCDVCAARVCACGACVLPKGRNGVACGHETVEEPHAVTVHGFHRCEVFRPVCDGGATFPPMSFTDRPDSCPCDACESVRAFPQYAAQVRP